MQTIGYSKDEILDTMNNISKLLKEERSKDNVDIEQHRKLMMGMLLQGMKLNVYR